MKIGNKKRINVWAVFLIVVLSALLLGFASYAAYTNLNSVKRVVSTQGLKGTPFSSNYLNLTASSESSYSVKNIVFPENAPTVTFSIDICNYVHNNPSKFNDNDINYTFTLTLVNADGVDLTGLTVTSGGNSYSFTDGVCSITGQTLAGRKKSVNTYVVTVPAGFVDKVKIEAVAEPDSASYKNTGNFKLGRLFAFTNKSETATTWTGRFAESTTDNYDGFNYILSGQGKGTITLSWQPDKLEINKIFLDTYGITPSGGSFTMDVDSDTKNRYDIQFYKTGNGDYSSIATVSSYVTISFTAE
ncbi:MAG: hypothetical protein ACI4J7_07220 [Ruminiclostridium sp.]